LAAASGLTTVNFSLTNTAGAASTMTANTGTTPQSATVGTAFVNALAVTVKDASNNPVSGVNVTFTGPASGAGGTFSNSTNTIVVATNSSGVASAPFTANGTAGGPYNVSAAASGVTTVNFSLTNTAQGLSVTCSTTNTGTVNVYFNSGPETVTGGVTPYTFYVGSGALPNGLSLNSSTGAVTGTPTKTGSFTIDVKDAAHTVAATGCPFTVGKATPVISWTPAPLPIDSKLGPAQLDATANVPGKFVYTPPAGTEITTPTETLKVVFTPTDTADYNSVTMTVALEVTTLRVSPMSINFGTVYLDSTIL
jgi:hypothetical protein